MFTTNVNSQIFISTVNHSSMNDTKQSTESDVCVQFEGADVGNENCTCPSLPLPLSLYLQGPCFYLLDRSLHLKQSLSQMNKVSPKTAAGMTNRAGHAHVASLLLALLSCFPNSPSYCGVDDPK